MDVSLFRDRSQVVNDLRFRHRSQRRHSERLRLSARKEGGAVNARQQSHFAGDGADLVKRASVRTNLVNRNHVAHDLLRQVVEAFRHIRCIVGINFLEMRFRFRFHFRHMGFAGQLIGIEDRRFQRFFRVFTDGLLNIFRDLRESDLPFRFAHFRDDLFLKSDELLDLLMREHDRVEHFFFRRFLRAAFYHEDRRFRQR